MQKWEYMTVLSDFLKVKTINGRHVTGWLGRDYADFLNRIGIEGWEAVGLAVNQEGYILTLLKRPTGDVA